MTLRTNIASVVVTLTGLSLVAGCHGHAPAPDAAWAQPVVLEGSRNEILNAVAEDTHVPAAVLYALAYQQSRFEDPDVTIDSTMDETIAITDDPELAAATDPWSDASPDEAGEPLQIVDDTTPIEGLEDVQAEIAADPSANDAFVLSDAADAADPDLDPTIPLPTSPDPTAEDLGEEHPETDAASIFFLTPEQVSWAATTLAISEDEVRDDLEASARATAALLLADLAVSNTPVAEASHQRWEEAMVRFVGLDPADEAGALAQDDFHTILGNGFDTVTQDGEEMFMLNAGGATIPNFTTPMDDSTGAVDEMTTGGTVAVETALSTDYPHTQWIAASSSNYTNGRGMSIRYVVIHDMEGTTPGAISVFRSPGRQASAHYLVGSTGRIVQMVREQDTAWHAGNWIINHSSIGIEHDGYADRPHGGGYYTSTLYETSAHLTCAIAHRYHIPVDRRHIFGHGNVSTNSNSTALCSDAQANAGVCGGASHHHDPGRYWDWRLYMNLVARCVSGHPHTSPAPAPTPTPHPHPSTEHAAITTGWGGQHAVVDSAGALHVFATDSAHRLVDLVRTAGRWASYHVVPTGGAVHGYPAAIVSGDRIIVAVRGTDDHIHVARQAGGSWTAVELTGLSVNTMPSMFVNQDGRAEIFVRGASDSALYHAAERSPGGDFGQWWNLGGTLRTMPTVIADAQHRPHVFAIGDADGHVWTRVRTSPTEWPSWTYLNVTGNTPVSPVRMPDGRLAVFTRNHTGALVSQFTDASGHWTLHPHTVGGVFTSNVVAIVDAHGRVNVFGRGTSSATYRVVQSTSGHWGSFARLGGRAIMGPAVVRTSNGLEVFVAGTNHGLYQAFQTSSSHTGWSGWHSRGGRLGWL